MKYFLVLLVSFFVVGCFPAQNGETKSKNNNNNESVIIDEEFDLLVAPEYDYESDISYEEQIKVSSKTQSNTSGSKTTKPAKHPVGTQAN